MERPDAADADWPRGERRSAASADLAGEVSELRK
jgi:hypothetical protein